MITITELAADTRCSRTTIYAAIKRLEIKPHKQKRNSLLDAQQVALIKEALPSDETPKEAAPTSKHQQKKPTETTTTTNNAQDSQHLLIKQLQEEGNHLKGLLEREQAERSTERIERAEERKAERERAERHDALVTALLSEQKGLRDEVQRLKALQAPELMARHTTAEEQDYAVEDTQYPQPDTHTLHRTSSAAPTERPDEQAEQSAERIERPSEHEATVEFEKAALQPEMIPSSSGSNGARAFGIIAFVVLAALAWVVITNPELPLREGVANIWQ